MINETSKLRIAIDIVEYKIAQKLVEIRDCNDEQTKKKLKEDFYELVKISDEVHIGNEKYINEIIRRNGGRKND